MKRLVLQKVYNDVTGKIDKLERITILDDDTGTEENFIVQECVSSECISEAEAEEIYFLARD